MRLSYIFCLLAYNLVFKDFDKLKAVAIAASRFLPTKNTFAVLTKNGACFLKMKNDSDFLKMKNNSEFLQMKNDFCVLIFSCGFLLS